MIIQIQEEDYPIYRIMESLEKRDRCFEKMYYSMNNIDEEISLEDMENPNNYEHYEHYENYES